MGLEGQPSLVCPVKSYGLVSAERDGYIDAASRYSDQQFASQHGDQNAGERAQEKVFGEVAVFELFGANQPLGCKYKTESIVTACDDEDQHQDAFEISEFSAHTESSLIDGLGSCFVAICLTLKSWKYLARGTHCFDKMSATARDEKKRGYVKWNAEWTQANCEIIGCSSLMLCQSVPGWHALQVLLPEAWARRLLSSDG
jgi:hypothetical protein